MLLCVNNPTGGMRLLACSFTSAFNRKGDTAAGACICLLFMVVLDGHLFQFSHLMFDYLEKKTPAFYVFFTPRKQRISLSVMGNIFPSQSFCLPCIHISTMNINNIGLSRMSTIFCLLISISSLHKSFISLGTLVKGSSSLPWLISSQPHRSQAFPNQCSLCSHKDPRNPAACPQLIFPVATLLTQPPTVRGCKCKGRNRLLCVHPQSPTSPPLAHSGVAKVSITLGG